MINIDRTPKSLEESSMRVALINNCAPVAGVGVYAFSLLHALRSIGDVCAEMICTETFPIDSGNVYDEVKFLSKIRVTPVNHLLDYFVFPLLMPKGCDIYHVTTQSLGRFVKFNHPSVVTVHDLSALRPEFNEWSDYGRITSYSNKMANAIWRLFHRKSTEDVRYADSIVCPSEFTKKELMDRLKVSGQRIRVIPNGVDHDLFKPRDKAGVRKRLGLPIDERIVLHVGDEGGRKNIPVLIEAFHKLRKKVNDAILVRVGDQRPSTKRLIERYHLENYVFYTGVVPSREDVAHFYNAADLFLFPSQYEGFGIPLLEAMASGCPILAGSSAAILEVVEDAAILVDPLDAELLALKAEEILREADLREGLFERGLRRASLFSWKRYAEEAARLYRKLGY